MIGIVIAMEKEAKHFIRVAEINKEILLAGKKAFEGKFAGKEFVLIISGIGKVNASISTQILIDKYNIEYIINIGGAGARSYSNLKTGDLTIIKEAFQFDFDLSEIDNVEVGYMQDYDRIYYPTDYQKYTGSKLKIATCATGDRFTQKEEFTSIIKNLNGQVVEMECAAIAQTCLSNNTPLFILKVITDVEGEDRSIFEQYYENIHNVFDRIPEAIQELLENKL